MADAPTATAAPHGSCSACGHVFGVCTPRLCPACGHAVMTQAEYDERKHIPLPAALPVCSRCQRKIITFDGSRPTICGDCQPATTAGAMPSVKSIQDAEFWIAVMHRRTCRDADHYVEVLDRLGSADAAILQLRRIVAFLLLASALLVAYMVVNL